MCENPEESRDESPSHTDLVADSVGRGRRVGGLVEQEAASRNRRPADKRPEPRSLSEIRIKQTIELSGANSRCFRVGGD